MASRAKLTGKRKNNVDIRSFLQPPGTEGHKKQVVQEDSDLKEDEDDPGPNHDQADKVHLLLTL